MRRVTRSSDTLGRYDSSPNSRRGRELNLRLSALRRAVDHALGGRRGHHLTADQLVHVATLAAHLGDLVDEARAAHRRRLVPEGLIRAAEVLRDQVQWFLATTRGERVQWLRTVDVDARGARYDAPGRPAVRDGARGPVRVVHGGLPGSGARRRH